MRNKAAAAKRRRAKLHRRELDELSRLERECRELANGEISETDDEDEDGGDGIGHGVPPDDDDESYDGAIVPVP